MSSTHSTMALFPGQGSQMVGLEKDLFEGSELARTIFAEAEQTLGFALSKLCFEGPQKALTETQIAQPAILTTSIIAFRLAQEFSGDRFSVVCGAGHSLGE